jgi:hypothetical protein
MCITTAVVIVGGVVSSGGLAAIAIKTLGGATRVKRGDG